VGIGRDPSSVAVGGPALGDAIERELWTDVFRSPIEEVVCGLGIEARRYGPIHALSVAGLPDSPMFNLILGAAEAGAAEHEHLASAVEWLEERGVRHRVPVTPNLTGSGAAEDWLNRNGYEREWGQTRFVRDTSPPEFRVPPELEVDDFGEYGPEAEGFGCYAVEAFDLDPLAQLIFDHLPRRAGWGCYAAIDEREVGIGIATMMIRGGVAQFGFAATREGFRGRGAHLALLRRRIAEAAHAGCHTIFAESEERLNDPTGPSVACGNLVRAGFRQVCVRPTWHSPAV
jgi:hypothetical protein